MSDSVHDKQDMIDKAVAQTLSFFDVFDYPLDILGLWRFLPIRCSLSELRGSLSSWQRKGRIEERNGLFFIVGREEIIEEQKHRYNHSFRKIKRAKAVSKLFSIFPGVRLIFLSNLIGPYNLRDGSDIDFFIVCKKDMLWLTRLWCAGLMKLLNLRPTKKNKRDKICLSFYAASSSQNLENLALPKDDSYFYYWILGLYKIYGKEEYYQDFLADNSWLRSMFPNYYAGIAYKDMDMEKDGSRWIRFWENKAKALELMFMSPDLKNAALSKQALISDDVLKLFLSDKRPYFRDLAQARLENAFGYYEKI